MPAPAARRIRLHRNQYEYPVAVLEPGRKWALESDPEGQHLISDGEGILAIEEVPDAWAPRLDDESCEGCGHQTDDCDCDPESEEDDNE
jgi:hypothetical protein